jgi:phenylacetate-CoA ligase
MSTMIYRAIAPLWYALHASRLCSTLFLLRGFERVRWQVGRIGARVRFASAVRRVPAYRDFVAQQPPGAIPVTDKGNYVAVYPMEARCDGGRIPRRGVVIDESSGSSGQPTNWIRGAAERETNARTIRLGLRQRFGAEPLFFINAFALGPWATGINLTLALSSWCRLKTLGPDITKIANTLRHFGPGHRYVIMGYPPFLKQLLDLGDVDWRAYDVSFIYGGEGMSESMRRYLQARGIARVYGSYGASDLELNIAAETDVTIALRRLLESRPEIAARVLRPEGARATGALPTGALPMIFQFNPADFFLESSDYGELLVTVCRPGYVAPKIRYNIHDAGHVMRFPELRNRLAECGVDVASLDPRALDLPLLFHYGRSDMSVAWYGCKIPPADVQEALFRLPMLASRIDAFQVQTFEDADGDKRLVVALELTPACATLSADVWATEFFDALAAVNQDFRESRRMAPANVAPRLAFFATGTGPFAGADIRIKRQYLAESVA